MSSASPLHPPAPPPDLQLQLIVDDDMLDEEHGAGSRRPSTASLSRFRSCPHLASVVNSSQDSPGSDMAPITDHEGNIIHTTPATQNTLQVDGLKPEPGGVRSAVATPTPPSTPGSSRRRDPMTSSFASRSQSQSNGVSPASTPKLSRRSRADTGGGAGSNHIPRTYSADSHGCKDDSDSADGAGFFALGGQPFKDDNVLKRFQDATSPRDTGSTSHLPFGDSLDLLDADRLSDTDDASSMHVTRRQARHHHQLEQHHHYQDTSDDSVDKCNRWLQSLKLNKSDKIKSRSHIQLPPI
ncbi:uncharacterized protein LOC106013452 [Aplysia californica]|uniref:Uncharacterized protein LOC106013452 n=1 Tax=Aplysia californica TaxID=6500 RepID=A0ABM1ABV8_APLCA|nr:uncharacterized protein LOC106013452 [Aplysia californica]